MTPEERDAFFEGYLESLGRLATAKARELKAGFIEELGKAGRSSRRSGSGPEPGREEPLLPEGPPEPAEPGRRGR